ncbi:hypothetical protein TGAM01_v203721 [Trichoderma gamsii]|uniref:Acylphosphatase-like domain-containing protein n=1 Tax=Trichoderma gamsii TaxID=398673 RepID=A0A2P4ZSR1_9HYPO|nr:hypothetical protein TGAM01_v203721 [Trichoderma gamsii]PON27340.1 hypothetical protein TGAM01_v203721 [Trichoderma gamsii]
MFNQTPPLRSANIAVFRRGLPLLYKKESPSVWRNRVVPQHRRRYGRTLSLVKDSSIAHAPTQVEGEAQGDDDVMQKFFKDIGQGPSHSKVEKVVTEDRDVVEGDDTFEVRR